MSQPIYLPKLESTIDGYVDSSRALIKQVATKRNAFGGAVFEHTILANSGGSVGIGQGTSDNIKTYNTNDAILPNMALVLNSFGGVVTPNYSDAILTSANQTNFIGVAKTVTETNVHDWIQIPLQFATPPARSQHAQFYITSSHLHMVFGGQSVGFSTFYNDTQMWDGQNWSSFIPSGGSPTARYGMAYTVDTTHNNGITTQNLALIYGGSDISGILDETWYFDGQFWTQLVFTGSTPGGLLSGAMAHHAAGDGYNVYFGGFAGGDSGISNSTWLLDVSDVSAPVWTLISPTTSPSARMGHCMCYDPVRQRTILFGGTDGSSITFSDTWEWDGTNWVLIQTTNSPSPRMFASMAYDPINKAIILFGGMIDSTLNANHVFNIYNDVWYYDGLNWTQKNFFGPSVRAAAGISFDKSKNYLLLFGGANGGPTRNKVFGNSKTAVYQDTWELLTLTNQVDVQMLGESYVYWDSSGLLAVGVGGLVRGSDTTTVTVTTKLPHDLNAGDKFSIELPADPNFASAIYTVTAVIDGYNFTYSNSGTVTASVNPIVISNVLSPSTIIGSEIPSVMRYLSAGNVPGTVTPNGFNTNNDGYDAIFGIVSEAPVTGSDGSLFQTLIGANRVGLVKMKIGAFHGFIAGLNPQVRYLIPPSGPVATEIMVVGNGLNTTTQVTFTNNALATLSASYSITSASNLSITVPNGAQSLGFTIHASTGNISQSFTVTPKIYSISASSHAIGSQITLTGTTFSLAAGTIGSVVFPDIGIPPNNLVFTGASGPITLPFVTTIAAGSNGVSLPTATIQVADASQFPTTGGTIYVNTSAGLHKSVGYTGISGNTFTGCFGGSGVMSTGNNVYYSFMVVDDSTIQVPIPPNSISGNITLGTTDGYTSIHLDVLTPPTITLIAPAIGPAGDNIAITGTGFLVHGVAGDGYGALSFVAGLQVISASRTIFNDTTMTVTVPTLPPGQASTAFNLVFTTDAGTVTSSLQFTIVAPPKFLTAANSTLNGGIDSVVTSIPLASTSGWPTTGSKFFVDSEQISYTSISSNTLLGCTRGINGTTASSHLNAAAANIYTFISQNNDFQGASGEMVRIFGEHGFTGVTLVGFGSYEATSFNFVNDGYVTAIVPPIVSPSNVDVPITIVAGAGSNSTALGISPSTNPHTFTVLEGLTITSIFNPGNVLGPATGKTGDTVFINGTNLLGVTSVVFSGNTNSAAFTIINPAVIQVTVPDPTFISFSGLTTGVITVNKSTFFTATTPVFTYYSSPTGLSVTSPAPDGDSYFNANGGYGTVVTLTGTNLNQGNPTYPIVNFGGIGPAPLGSVGPTSISVTVPNGANSGITVTTAGGSISVGFNVLKPVFITRFYTDWPYDHTYATPFYPSNIDVYGGNFRDHTNSVIVISNTSGGVIYISSFTYYDSSHIRFDASSLEPFVGQTCYITVYTYYPGGSYNANVYGLNIFNPVT